MSTSPPASPAASSSGPSARYVTVMPLATQKGGSEMMFRHLVTHRPTSEWVVVFLEEGPMVEECRQQGLETHVLDSGRLRHPLHFYRTVRRLVEIIRSTRAQGVLSWLGKAHLYGGIAALLAGVPATWYQLGLPADVHWMDRLATLIPARGVLTCSHAGAAQQETLWPTRRTEVVHPGVDLDRFDPSRLPSSTDLRNRFDLPPDVPIVGTVGRLQHWKGMHVFIDALARLRTDYPDVRGVIVGGTHDLEPEYPSQLRRQIEHRDLEDCIIMSGFQSDPAAWMSTFDVFVHASDREPFGLVVLEAMALGLPVVASDTAGPTEMITAEETGLFASFGDDAGLAHQIRRYLDAPDWAAEVGRAARTRAQDFSAPRFATRVASTVRSLVSSSPSPSS